MKKSGPVNSRSKVVSPTKSLRPQALPKIDDIHNKIVNSAALNGGFDTLLYKIDKIEQSQGQLVAKVDKIHEAIYDPNDGMFAKLSEHKLESEVKLNEITQKITTLDAWKSHREKVDDKEEKDADQTSSKLVNLEKSVDSLTKSKESAWGVLKWAFVAIGGGIITLFFGWLETKIK